MTTCLGKSCSFGLPRLPFVNCCHFMYVFSYFPFGFHGQYMGSDLSVPDHCLSFYLSFMSPHFRVGRHIVFAMVVCPSVCLSKIVPAL